MPRINAPTVAEHRAAQQRAILDAADELLHETHHAPSLAQVAERAGLARTSIYQYFGSQKELLQALAREVFPRWTERIAGAVAAAPTPGEAVVAYAIANIELVAEGSHAVGTALANLDPEEDLDGQAQAMHAKAREPLVGALAGLGIADPDAIADLVTAVIHAAGRMIESGQDLDTVRGHLRTVLAHLAGPPSAPDEDSAAPEQR
jgi:AcrR family transcriptional regulator